MGEKASASVKKRASVSVIMGSHSDWPTMKLAKKVLEDFAVPCEVDIVSAHRTPEAMQSYALKCQKRGIKVIIAGAGGAAHLPGMVAGLTSLPVIGVPIMTKTLKGLDSLLSIAQMPKGVPVATVAIDNAYNAALLAVRILAIENAPLRKKIHAYMEKQKEKSQKSKKKIKQ